MNEPRLYVCCVEYTNQIDKIRTMTSEPMRHKAANLLRKDYQLSGHRSWVEHHEKPFQLNNHF